MSFSASPVPVKYNERCQNNINTITMFITLGGAKKIWEKKFRSCVLKASTVECRSIPSLDPWLTIDTLVDTQSTPHQHLGQELTNFCILMPLSVDWYIWVGCHSANYWLSVDQVLIEMWIECWLTIDRLSIKCWLRCWLSVDWVSIMMVIECWDMLLIKGQSKVSIIDTWPEVP